MSVSEAAGVPGSADETTSRGEMQNALEQATSEFGARGSAAAESAPAAAAESSGGGGDAPAAGGEAALHWVCSTPFGTYLESMQAKFEDAMKKDNMTQEENPKELPFKSKYEAREIFKEMLSEIGKRLKGILDTRMKTGEAAPAAGSDEAKLEDFIRGTSGLIRLHLGSNFIDAEEVADGEAHLKAAVEILEPLKADSRYSIACIKIQNTLGVLWASRGDHEKSLSYLEKAQTMFTAVKKGGTSPQGVVNLIPLAGGAGEEGWTDLESTYTMTLFFLAQCYGNLGNGPKSAEHCTLTLQRQIESQKYDALDWAINASGISQFYLGTSDWSAAANCLIGASHVAKSAATDDMPEAEEEKHMNIARCWIKYCINLMEAGIPELAATNEKSDPLTYKVEFACIKDDVKEQLETVPMVAPESFEQAKAIFQLGQKYVRTTLTFWTMTDHVSDYVEILQDHSRLYQRLARFTVDANDQCKLHKRRIDMLAGIEKELNPQYFLQVCRQLQFEVAETYQEMMNLKCSLYSDANPPSQKQQAKINTLGAQGILWYDRFMDTLRDMKTKEIPEKLEGHVIRPYLLGKFNQAAIWRKFQCAHPKNFVENSQKAVTLYGECMAGGDANPEYRGFDTERRICEDMIEMIPIKVQRTLDLQLKC